MIDAVTNKPEKDGYSIRVGLMERELTQKWLINELRNKGFVIGKSELSRILHGKASGAKCVKVLNASYEALKEHDGR